MNIECIFPWSHLDGEIVISFLLYQNHRIIPLSLSGPIGLSPVLVSVVGPMEAV
jgi:hypothetical protein